MILMDIATLQILEEYLQDFKGCVIVIESTDISWIRLLTIFLYLKEREKIDDFPYIIIRNNREWNHFENKKNNKSVNCTEEDATTKQNTYGVAKNNKLFV